MGRKIKDFADSTYLEYDRGSFDDWCVYMVQPNGRRRPPYDVDYFGQLQELSNVYGAERVYGDYVSIYNLTGNEINEDTLNFITELSNKYDENSLVVDKIFSILYMAMISEERRVNTRLGKRIKRLGIHILLMEGGTVEHAANFMRGMGWREISDLCTARGF